MNNPFSQKVSEIIIYSKEEAIRLNNNYIGPEHLLLGLIRDGEGRAIEILNSLNANLPGIKKEIERNIIRPEVPYTSLDEEITLNEKASKILRLSILESRLLKSGEAGTEHLVLAILKEEDNLAASVLKEQGIEYNKVYEMLTLQPDINSGPGFTEEDEDDDEDYPGTSNANGMKQHAKSTASSRNRSANDTPVLDNFGTDITQAAEEGKLDPIVGREREIERLAQILSRRKKNNPILIGEPGVGKSAIVEGLAIRIVQKKVSRILFNKRVIALDMTSVVAGTKYRGQFEERIRSILSELKRNPNIILFIEEPDRAGGYVSAA